MIKVLNVDEVTLTSNIILSYTNIGAASERVIDHEVTSPSDHCHEISILAGQRPGISVYVVLFFYKKNAFMSIFFT